MTREKMGAQEAMGIGARLGPLRIRGRPYQWSQKLPGLWASGEGVRFPSCFMPT